MTCSIFSPTLRCRENSFSLTSSSASIIAFALHPLNKPFIPFHAPWRNFVPSLPIQFIQFLCPQVPSTEPRGGATPPCSLWSGLGGVRMTVHVQVSCRLDSTVTLLEKMPGGDAGHWALPATACVQEPGAQEASLCRAELLHSYS